MERKLRYSLFVAPFAAVAVALATLFWFSGASSEIRSPTASWPSFGSNENIPTEPARLDRSKLVELEVKDVIPIEEANTHAVVLTSKDGAFMLPIFVTEEAAVSIAFRLAQRDSPHPLAADLLDDVVDQMGGQVTEVTIDDVQNDIYTSNVVIRQAGKDLTISARPSDAIAMALTGKARIMCAQKVLAQAGITREEIDSLQEHMGIGGGGDMGGGGGPEEGMPPMDEEGPGNVVPMTPDESNIRL